jgi:hypothetical protein
MSAGRKGDQDYAKKWEEKEKEESYRKITEIKAKKEIKANKVCKDEMLLYPEKGTYNF